MSMPALKKLRGLIDVAAGRREASIYLEGGMLVNVISGEIYPANIAIYDDKIAYVGASKKMVGASTTVIDAKGFYICPALIEPHFHPNVGYNPASLAEVALCRGITTIVCDSIFFHTRLGAQGLLKIIKSLENLPIRLFWTARIFYQGATETDTNFSETSLRKLFRDPHIIKIGEIARWPLIVDGNESLLEKICLAREYNIGVEGHTAGCSYDRLNAIAASGTESCHEAITAEEAAERLRLGLWTMLRNSSLRPDLPELIQVITLMRLHTGRILFTTDGPSPSFIAREGLLDGMLRLAVKAGVNPVTALQIATINPATYLGIEKEVGSITPGRHADILLLPDLENFNPHMVFFNGKVVAVAGKLSVPLTPPDWKEAGLHLNLSPLRELVSVPFLFGVPADKPKVFPVINFISSVITKQQDCLLEPHGGFLERKEDMLYCALIDRYGKWVVNGFIRGLGLVEALATTGTSAFNILVFGQNRSSMARAAAEVVEMNGGIALIEDGQVSFRMPLELGGLMSSSPFAVIADKTNELEKKALKFGYPYNDFIYTLAFLTSDFLPELRITTSGIVNIKSRQILFPAQEINQLFDKPRA